MSISCINVRMYASVFRCAKHGQLLYKNCIGQNLHFQNIQTPVKFYCARNAVQVHSSNASSPLTLLKVIIGGGAVVGVKAAINRGPVLCEAMKPKELNVHKEEREHHTRINTDEVHADSPSLTWAQFWHLLHPQFHYFIAACISALIVALANVEIPMLLGEVVNVISRFSEGGGPSGGAFVQEILPSSIKLLEVYLGQSVFTFLYITFLNRMSERMASAIRQELFASYLKQDIAFYDKHKTGELVDRLTTDVQDFKSAFRMCISQGLRSITQIIGCGISLYRISPGMAGLTAIVVPTVILIGTLLGTLLRSLSRAAQQQVALATAVADECLGNMRTVRAFAMEEEEAELFQREIEKSRHLNEVLGMGIGLFQAGTSLFLNGVVLGTLYAGGSLLSAGQMQPGQLMSFLVSAQTIQRSLSHLSVTFGMFVRGMSAGGRVFEHINVEAEIPTKGGKIIPYHTLTGTLEYRNVSFSYPTRPDQKVLEDFSLRIPAGRIVAIVGASGGGKSTIAQLTERFYDVNSGSVSIDGVDLRSLDPSWLRGRVLGFINQEPTLFATTVMENIRYGRPDATDIEVIEAAKTANAHEFIMLFPNGYSTVVGERGIAVSGGQKQRIAIARAIIKNPSILILDEATSALDAESEAVVQAALEKAIKGRTVIVIAHRLSTIQNADVIAVLNKGRLVELGTHEGLKKLGGIYADLIRQQQR